jgi:glyoxylase-like metal-dependent hydrolase (beta-lactamase superfamily II)
MWKAEPIVFENFKLDGGAMFGIIPKPIWSKLAPADSENRIQLVTRSLLLKRKDKVVLIDCGCGNKWDEKRKQIYAIEPNPTNLDFAKVTDVFLTHLHFDHGGGISQYRDGKLAATFPNATIYISEQNLLVARNPSLRERGSYLPENVNLVAESAKTYSSSEVEILDGVHACLSFGHTSGLSWFKIKSDAGWIIYPSDLMPTHNHIKLHYNLGYDMCVERLLVEKKTLVEEVLRLDARVVFTHDPVVVELSADRFKDLL